MATNNGRIARRDTLIPRLQAYFKQLPLAQAVALVRPLAQQAGVTAALQSLADPDRTVMVHCHMGVNRGPSMAFAAMIATGWDPVEALTAIRAARPVAVVLYAEDAVRWAFRGDPTATKTAVAAVHRWFREHVSGAEWIIGRLDPLG